jgi:hypothetical protein
MENALLNSRVFRLTGSPHAADSRLTMQPCRVGQPPEVPLARLRRFPNSISAMPDRTAAALT